MKKFSNRYFLLPDPIPELKYVRKEFTSSKNYCVYVNSYAQDEPYAEVIKAAKILKPNLIIICTGQIPKRLDYLKKQPFENIYFTDYLPEKEYTNLIANACLILALTNEESTLLCSGYEALSVDTPLVISDMKVLREYFGDSVIYTKNTGCEIAESIEICLKRQDEIRNKMQELKKSKRKLMGLVLTSPTNR